MRRQPLVLESEEVDRLPSVCVRDGWPAATRVLKTFRAKQVMPRLLRYTFGVPLWLLSLLYRQSRQIALPVCNRCARKYRIRRAAVRVCVAGIVLGFGGVAVHHPGLKIGSGYLAPAVYLACLPLLVCASIWVWRYPAHGVVEGARVHVIGASPHFKNAFRNTAATPGASLFTWPAPTSGGQVSVHPRAALAGTVLPQTQSPPPRHATPSGDPITGWVFHAKRLSIAVTAVAMSVYAAWAQFPSHRANQGEAATQAAPVFTRALPTTRTAGKILARTLKAVAARSSVTSSGQIFESYGTILRNVRVHGRSVEVTINNAGELIKSRETDAGVFSWISSQPVGVSVSGKSGYWVRYTAGVAQWRELSNNMTPAQQLSRIRWHGAITVVRSDQHPGLVGVHGSLGDPYAATLWINPRTWLPTNWETTDNGTLHSTYTYGAWNHTAPIDTPSTYADRAIAPSTQTAAQ